MRSRRSRKVAHGRAIDSARKSGPDAEQAAAAQAATEPPERTPNAMARDDASGLVAPLAKKRKHLQQKGATRPHKAIARRLPAGSADLQN